MVIPERFRTEIRSHVVLNYANASWQPLVLGIFGRPGDGKSFQLRSVLSELKVSVQSINAADLESDRAGTPAKVILEAYVTAGHAIANGRITALVIDDFDTTVGEWQHNTGTVNHQQILAQVMHLADNPSYVERIGVLRRVPIVLTGNDFSKLYAPLKRPGRMHPFFWEPTTEELQEIVSGILENWPSDLRSEVVRTYSHAPIAFFAQLHRELIRRSGEDLIVKMSRDLARVIDNPERTLQYLEGVLDYRDLNPAFIKGVADDLLARADQSDVSHLRVFRPASSSPSVSR